MDSVMEQNKMSALPWSVKLFDDTEPIRIAIMCPSYGVARINYNDIVAPVSLADAEAIVSAVNNTYGQNIHPEAIPEVVRTLKNLIDYFDWLIKDPNFPAYREAKAAIEKINK